MFTLVAYKHKESDIRKRNELQNEAVALQMPDTFFIDNFLTTAAFISETCECSLTSTNTKVFFSSEPGFVVEAGIIANCLGKFLVDDSVLRRHQVW